MSEPILKVREIFFSLQGEATRTGTPTVFVRFSGCPLRCRWCDTEYAFTGGETMSLPSVMATIAAHPTRHVCVTGGEPLAQKACAPFVTALCDAGYDVCLETSGAYPIEGIDTRVSRIMDLKPPSSGEVDKNRWENLAQLTAHDEIKIVIASRADYVWASSVLATYPALAHTCPVWLSPAHGRQSARKLAEWLLADGLPARLQVQLHRRLWGNMVGK